MFAVTLFTYSELLGSVGFIPNFAVSYNKNGVAQIVSNLLAFIALFSEGRNLWKQI